MEAKEEEGGAQTFLSPHLGDGEDGRGVRERARLCIHDPQLTSSSSIVTLFDGSCLASCVRVCVCVVLVVVKL